MLEPPIGLGEQAVGRIALLLSATVFLRVDKTCTLDVQRTTCKLHVVIRSFRCKKTEALFCGKDHH